MTPTRIAIEPHRLLRDDSDSWLVRAQYGDKFGWSCSFLTEDGAHRVAAIMRLRDVATKEECERALHEARVTAFTSGPRVTAL